MRLYLPPMRNAIGKESDVYANQRSVDVKQLAEALNSLADYATALITVKPHDDSVAASNQAALLKSAGYRIKEILGGLD